MFRKGKMNTVVSCMLKCLLMLLILGAGVVAFEVNTQSAWSCPPKDLTNVDEDGEEDSGDPEDTDPGDGGESDDPIAYASGNSRLSEVDAVISCPLMNLSFSRAYNSKPKHYGRLGHKWVHAYEWNLSEKSATYRDVSGNWVVVRSRSNPALGGGGSTLWFHEEVSGSYKLYDDMSGYGLEKLEDESYKMIQPGGLYTLFDANGVLQQTLHPAGASLTCTYTNSLLTRIEHSNGQYFDLTYNTNNLLSKLETISTNFYVSYFYNASRELTNVVRHTSSGDTSTLYKYDPVNGYSDHLMTQRINANGDVFNYEYKYMGSPKPYKDVVRSADLATGVSVMDYTEGLGREIRATGMHIDPDYYKVRMEYHPARAKYRKTTSVSSVQAAPPSPPFLSISGSPSAEGGTSVMRPDRLMLRSSSSRNMKEARKSTHSMSQQVSSKCGCGNTESSEAPTTSESQDQPIKTETKVLLGYTEPYTDIYLKRNGKEEHTRAYYDRTTQFITNKVTEYHIEDNTYDGNYDLIARKVVSKSDSAKYLDTRYSYDSNHNVIETKFGYCATPEYAWSYGWNPDWNVMTNMVDPEGNEVVFEYTDALMSKVSVVAGAGETYDSTFGYNTNGWLVAVTNANGHWVRFEHDSSGNVTSTIPQVGPVVQYGCDQLGFVTNVSLPGLAGPRVRTAKVDELGRVWRAGYPDGSSESVVYDSMGNITNVTDRGGRSTALTYYPTRKLSSVTRVLEGNTNQDVTTSFVYNEQFNSLRIIDALNREVESYELDLSGRILSVTNYEGQVLNINYEVGGYASSINRFDGTSITNGYDSAGRISSVQYADDANVFSYYDNSRLKTAANQLGAISNKYDAANRLIQVDGANPGDVIDYTYLPAGQVSNMVSIAGTNTYSYDEAERVARIEDSVCGYDYSYDQYNGLISLVSNDVAGVNVSYGYDIMDQLTNVVWRDAYGASVRSFDYLYNDVGMITQKLEVAGSQVTTNVYEYDTLDRLVKETASGAITSLVEYAYDLVGNRTTVVENGVTNSYTLGDGNRMSSWTSGSYGHDAAGCVTNIVKGSDEISLNWNGQYQVTSISTNGTTAETYEYDALGRRTAIIDGGETNYLVYNGIHCIAEVDATGALKKSYTYGSGIDNILSFTDHVAGKTYYMITDHLGSVHAVTDENGDIVEQYRYDAWGRVSAYDGSGTPISETQIGNRYLWQGREYSWKTGLYYFRARWYDPITGRWLSKDPIGIAGGLNQYVFCSNNPVNRKDPLGLDDVAKEKERDDFTKEVMDKINPISIKEDKEYFGWIYRDDDGNLKTTTPAQGDQHSIPKNKRPPRPDDAEAWWHTHGAESKGYNDEKFSGKPGSKNFKDDTGFSEWQYLDGYVNTPKNNPQKYDVETDTIKSMK